MSKRFSHVDNLKGFNLTSIWHPARWGCLTCPAVHPYSEVKNSVFCDYAKISRA
ncbi:hypothetical protein Q7O_000152 [Pectobacterium carotovorum subsp. carotovorum PCCS1]|nr:hypothetical protein [Pectobacterium carotovorum subsp. carotovorum PCCS1]